MDSFKAICVASASAVAALPTAVSAAEFRIETDIFQQGAPDPISQNVTLFQGETVYDFLLGESQEVTIFDFRRERIVLLDVQRRMQTSISLDDLIELTARLQVHWRQSDDALTRFLAEPKFKVTEKTGELRLDSEYLDYRLQGKGIEDADTLAGYRQFADWSARLNATRRGGHPPFARLKLNEEMAPRRLMPHKVTLLVKPGGLGAQTIELSSRHLTVWRLLETDRTRIKKAADYLGAFNQVSFKTYRNRQAGLEN